VNPTEQLAENIVGLEVSDLTSRVREVVREVLIDGFANMIGGSVEPLAAPIGAYIRDLGGPPRATVVGHGFDTHPVHAAFVNAIFCHSMDFELVSYPPTHPVSPTLPALLALSQEVSLDADQFTLSLVAALETTGRLRSASPPTRGIHPPGSVGMMGAAAGCAKALRLTVEETRITLGIAASRIAGLMGNSGTMTKATHCGHAARMGLESALLARAGITANPSILDAAKGYNEVFFENQADLSQCSAPFGDPFWMVTPGFAVKKYPAQYTTHWSLEAALEIQADDPVDPASIETIEIEVGSNHVAADRPLPRSGLDGKFSLQYTVAAAILDRSVGIDTFRNERLARADMQNLLPKIRVVKNQAIDSEDFDKARAKVTVTSSSQPDRAAVVERPDGIWDRPLPWKSRVEKFIACASRVYPAVTYSKLLAQISDFEACTDVGELMRLTPPDSLAIASA